MLGFYEGPCSRLEDYLPSVLTDCLPKVRCSKIAGTANLPQNLVLKIETQSDAWYGGKGGGGGEYSADSLGKMLFRGSGDAVQGYPPTKDVPTCWDR